MKAHTFFRLSISIELLKKNIRKAIIKYSKKKTWRGFTNKKFKKYKKNSFTQKFQIPATHCQWRPASHPIRSSISADGTCRNLKRKKKDFRRHVYGFDLQKTKQFANFLMDF